MTSDFNRRDFLATCAVLAASLAACSSGGQRARAAASFIIDPAIDDYNAALRALIETVLPLGSPGFPLHAAAVEERLLRMFPLEDERRFLGFQRTLVYFDQLDLAPHIAAPLLAAERVALDVPTRMSEAQFGGASAAKVARESAACDAFAQRFAGASRFAALPPEGRVAWLRLWNGSELAVKRDFAHSVRILIYVSAYSSDRTWPAIRYAGPLIPGPERRS